MPARKSGTLITGTAGENLSRLFSFEDRASAWNQLVFVVANSSAAQPRFEEQALDTFAVLDKHLQDAGSNRTRILSAQVLLRDIHDKPAFDELWLKWIGTDPAAWPQRSCCQVGLSGSLLIEIVAVAVREETDRPSVT